MIDTSKSFSEYCTSCGSCCKRLHISVPNIKKFAIDNKIDLNFPYSWDETGKCENLMDDNRCKIYYDRPLICNIEKLIEVLNVNRNKFFEINIKSCNLLIDQDNLDKSYKIVLK